MSRMFNPWEDARLIAERLRYPGARLLVFLGAEAWCSKCSTLRPHIETLSMAAPDDETWLWLDLEDHAEFLGDYVPDDLPQLVIYEGTTLRACKTLTLGEDALRDSVGRPDNLIPELKDPGIRTNLLREDWVVS